MSKTIETTEDVVRELIADVVALREEIGDRPSIKALERKLGRLLPPVTGRLHIEVFNARSV
jgi:hypothetical protein